jgi:hypothetical protein
VVEAGVGELPGRLQVALGVGAAGDRLLEVVGGEKAVAASKLTGLGSSAWTFQPRGPNRISSWAEEAAVSSSGAQARGTSP